MKWFYWLFNTVPRRLTPAERAYEEWLYSKLQRVDHIDMTSCLKNSPPYKATFYGLDR